VRGAVSGQLAQEVDVAHHERGLRDDADRVPELGEHLEAAPRDPERALGRLVAVGVARERDHLGRPARRQERPAQELGRVGLHHDARLEVDAGVEAELLVRGTRVAVVGCNPGRKEGARRRLNVDHVVEASRLDRVYGLRIDVHLAAEECKHLSNDRGPADREKPDPIDQPADET
jgi:hypothetical protein